MEASGIFIFTEKPALRQVLTLSQSWFLKKLFRQKKTGLRHPVFFNSLRGILRRVEHTSSERCGSAELDYKKSILYYRSKVVNIV